MGKGRRVAVKAEEAVEFTQAELITLLQSTEKKLETLLGTKDIIFDERLKVVLGFMDRNTNSKIWPLMNKDGQVPVTFTPREERIYQLKKQCDNGAGAAGDQLILFTPAAGSILSIYFMSQQNLDGVNRTLSAYLASLTNQLVGYMYNDAVAADAVIVWPRNSGGIDRFDVGAEFIVNDQFKFIMKAAAIAASQNSRFYIFYKYIGDEPTIAYQQPAGATWSNIS